MNVLCIIDMQTEFWASASKPVVRNVLREIDSAKYNGWTIFVVEFMGYGRTRTKILSALKDYCNTYLVEKIRCDGAGDISRVALSVDIEVSGMRICGVNTDQCVAHTANTLAEHNPTIPFEIVLDACNSHSEAVALGYSECHRFQNFPNLSLVCPKEIFAAV